MCPERDRDITAAWDRACSSRVFDIHLHYIWYSLEFVVDCSMAVRRPTNAGYSLLGMRPPLNEPRMQGPLLQAPYELLPPPLSMERRDRPLLPSSPPPPRSAMHMQSPGGFHHEPSPPRCVLTVLSSFRRSLACVLTLRVSS